nr:ATP-binding cassette domain-containing protein [Escherichia coli]
MVTTTTAAPVGILSRRSLVSDTLLTLRDVHINFPARKNWLGKTTEHVHVINGIDLQIRRGETLGIVGESGCGKSTLAQLLMGMLQPSHGQYIRSGSQRIIYRSVVVKP